MNARILLWLSVASFTLTAIGGVVMAFAPSDNWEMIGGVAMLIGGVSFFASALTWFEERQG
jgi:uncharacterized membrane protein